MKTITYSVILMITLFLGCGDPDPKQVNQETVNRGTATILCDDAVFSLMSAAKPYYDTAFPDAKISLQSINARDAMIQLLGGKARGIIIARDYLRDEDSAMLLHTVAPHQRVLFAVDGIVFFANKTFPLDTLSKEQIVEAMTSREPKMTQAFPHLKIEPVFVITGSTSSLYGNVMNQIANGASPKRPMKIVSTADSVAVVVKNTPGAIGVGYLSKYGRDTSVKLLKIGFTDTTGKRIYPQKVHPGNIVQGRYPFPVNYYGYLLEDRMNLPWGFFTYMRTNERIQKSFLDAGIIPGFAKLELIVE